MFTETPQSPYKRMARRVIQAVIADHVHGRAETLVGDDLRILRAKIREAYPFAERRGWAYACWLEEVRVALGFPVPQRRYRTLPTDQRRSVLPSMRAWAEKRGLLAHS